MKIISLLFILFGLYAFIFPKGLISNMSNSYTVPDLIRGWGIYSITLGSVLYCPNYIKELLLLCFIVSIIWHIEIAQRIGWTRHHKESIIINLIVILIVFLSRINEG
jgi:hypothetical protein